MIDYVKTGHKIAFAAVVALAIHYYLTKNGVM